MRPLWRDVVRVAAEWVVLILLGGALGIGTAEAVAARLVSERTVLVGFGTLIAVSAAFMIWAARDLYLHPWDDWDDDADASPDA